MPPPLPCTAMMTWRCVVAWGGVSYIRRPLSTPAADVLRKQLRLMTSQFVVVLIGKDGGEKLRRTHRVDLGEIFALIDAMPMRRQEMRERQR